MPEPSEQAPSEQLQLRLPQPSPRYERPRPPTPSSRRTGLREHFLSLLAVLLLIASGIDPIALLDAPAAPAAAQHASEGIARDAPAAQGWPS